MFLQLFGDLGIPIHSRELAKAVIALNKNTNLVPLFTGDMGKLEQGLKSNIKKADFNNPSFIFWYPNTYEDIIGISPKTIGYYIFEYTKIPNDWIKQINKLDLICTASDWGKSVLINNGVNIRVEVIRGGVNSSVYNTSIRNIWNKETPFVFGNIGKFENRKNTELLVKTFIDTFGDNKDVKLLLSIDNQHLPISPQQYLENKYGKFKNIEYIHHIPDIKLFYKKIHCAVFPTNAEGIGLPITETMACGIPTIVSNNSGISEYANHDNAILLNNLSEIPVFDPVFFPRSGEFGEWSSPTKEELSEKMKYVVENYEASLSIGSRAADYMKNIYNWNEPAKRLLEIIDAL